MNLMNEEVETNLDWMLAEGLIEQVGERYRITHFGMVELRPYLVQMRHWRHVGRHEAPSAEVVASLLSEKDRLRFTPMGWF